MLLFLHRKSFAGFLAASVMIGISPAQAGTFVFQIQPGGPGNPAPFELAINATFSYALQAAPPVGFGYQKTKGGGQTAPIITPFSANSIAASGIVGPINYGGFFDVAKFTNDGLPTGGVNLQLQFGASETRLDYIGGGPTFYYRNYGIMLRHDSVISDFDTATLLTDQRLANLFTGLAFNFSENGRNVLCQSNQDPACVPISGYGVGGSATFLRLEAAAVPEPASWAMMISGFSAIGGAMRYRRRRVKFA